MEPVAAAAVAVVVASIVIGFDVATATITAVVIV
jgi:hypothetical protein